MFALRMDWGLAVAVGIPLGLGSLAGFLTRNESKSAWYNSLSKPSWTPPGYVFGPVWTLLYILMGVASWRVWKAGGGQQPMVLYALQLTMNLAWSFLFFNAKNLQWALLDILGLLGVLVATTAAFYRVDRVAGYLMLPYVAWVGFAAALTISLYKKNPDA